LKSELEVIEDLIKGKKNAIDEHKELSKNTQNNKKLFVTIENSTLWQKKLSFKNLKFN
jgi:hypothetical protein